MQNMTDEQLLNLIRDAFQEAMNRGLPISITDKALQRFKTVTTKLPITRYMEASK